MSVLSENSAGARLCIVRDPWASARKPAPRTQQRVSLRRTGGFLLPCLGPSGFSCVHGTTLLWCGAMSSASPPRTTVDLPSTAFLVLFSLTWLVASFAQFFTFQLWVLRFHGLQDSSAKVSSDTHIQVRYW